MIPKARLEALTDGVYAFAMTLLVIDLRLPDNFRPASTAEFLHALSDLWGQFLVYVISFWVLGLRWLGQTQQESHHEMVPHGVGTLALLGLFFVTCVPFSTMLVGRYADFAPAVWVYGANMGFASLVSLRLLAVSDDLTPEQRADGRDPSLAIIAAAVLSSAITLVGTRYALWAYALTAFPSLLRRGRPGKTQ